jgi:hypothetical protein
VRIIGHKLAGEKPGFEPFFAENPLKNELHAWQ